MKKRIINSACSFVLSALCACFFLISCTEENNIDDKKPPKLSAVSFSSVVAAPGSTEVLAKGTSVGVSINEKSSLFTTGENGLLMPISPLFWENEDIADVRAWHTAKVSADNLTCPTIWEVSEDQTKGYEESSFLYAQKEVRPDSDDKQLKFSYQTSLIEIKIISPLKVSDVTIGDKNTFKISANWKEGIWTSEKGKTAAIRPYSVRSVGDTTILRATVIPQDVTGKSFITLTFEDGHSEEYVPQQSEGHLRAGHMHTFTMSVATPIPAPVLSADKYQILNNGEKSILTVMQKNKDVTSQATLTMNGQLFDGHVFSSSTVGSFEFSATVGDKVSNPIIIVVVEAPKPEPIVPQLTASSTTIIADGKSSITFTVSPPEAVITCDELPEFTGTVFSTKEAGTFHFKATLGKQISNVVTVIAARQAMPILSADTYQIQNDGEKATLKVTLDDKDVTDKASLLKNGQPFSGHIFTSSIAGAHEFVATIDGMTSNAVTIKVIEAPKPEPVIPVLNANASTIIADGQSSVAFTVTPETGIIICEEDPEFIGKVFTTTTAGTYHFKATLEGQTSNMVIIMAIEPEPEPELDVEVSVTSPSTDGAWEDQGSNGGIITT